jgi:hypothetical protein
MNFEHDTSWDNLENVVESGPSIKHGWAQIIDFHESIKDKSYWRDLKNLDIQAEQKQIQDWLESIVTEEPFDKSIVAFWIGINKFLDDAENEVYAIYLVGCDTYDEEDAEWATEPTYLPENRYFISGVLNEIDKRIKEDKQDYSILDWILPLAYCSLTLNDIIKSKLDISKFLKHRDTIFVTTGHDGGDYLNLSPIEKK